MSTTEAWTHRRLLEWTTGFLEQHGSESPRLEAELLLAEAVGCQRIELYTSFESVPADGKRDLFRELVRQRAAGTPVAYLLGRREFYSLEFHVTRDVLVPRPETEFLVVRALDLLKSHCGDRSPQVADIGTGSGNIAVSIAKHAPRAQVVAVDISSVALAVAADNVRRHKLEEQIQLIESELFDAVEQTAQFDLIVSNPPYITTAELAELPPEVADHEPRLALDGGPQGVSVIEQLIPQAAERLVVGGHLLLEVSPTTVERVAALIEADGRFERLPTVQDLSGLPRVVGARRC